MDACPGLRSSGCILKIQSSYKGAFSEKSCSHFAVNRCGANKEAKTYGHTEDMEAGG